MLAALAVGCHGFSALAPVRRQAHLRPLRATKPDDVASSITSAISEPLPDSASATPGSLAVAATTATTATTAADVVVPFANDDEYRKGVATIFFITLLFASNSPALKFAFTASTAIPSPPVLILNAAVAVVALVGLLVGGPLLSGTVDDPSTLRLRYIDKQTDEASQPTGHQQTTRLTN